jgi:hypothetical protein
MSLVSHVTAVTLLADAVKFQHEPQNKIALVLENWGLVTRFEFSLSSVAIVVRIFRP